MLYSTVDQFKSSLPIKTTKAVNQLKLGNTNSAKTKGQRANLINFSIKDSKKISQKSQTSKNQVPKLNFKSQEQLKQGTKSQAPEIISQVNGVSRPFASEGRSISSQKIRTTGFMGITTSMNAESYHGKRSQPLTAKPNTSNREYRVPKQEQSRKIFINANSPSKIFENNNNNSQQSYSHIKLPAPRSTNELDNKLIFMSSDQLSISKDKQAVSMQNYEQEYLLMGSHNVNAKNNQFLQQHQFLQQQQQQSATTIEKNYATQSYSNLNSNKLLLQKEFSSPDSKSSALNFILKSKLESMVSKRPQPQKQQSSQEQMATTTGFANTAQNFFLRTKSRGTSSPLKVSGNTMPQSQEYQTLSTKPDMLATTTKINFGMFNEDSENKLLKRSINQNNNKITRVGTANQMYRGNFNLEKAFAYNDGYLTCGTSTNNNTTASTNKRPSTRAQLSQEDYKHGFNPMMIVSIQNDKRSSKENHVGQQAATSNNFFPQRPNIRISKTSAEKTRKRKFPLSGEQDSY